MNSIMSVSAQTLKDTLVYTHSYFSGVNFAYTLPQWAQGHDETVEVNQRALIDKILARYSGEFTVFRELLQNSDDAHATAVEITFETRNSLDRKKGANLEGLSSEVLPDLKTALVCLFSTGRFAQFTTNTS